MISRSRLIIPIILLALIRAATAGAFSPGSYASRSVLADGKWICVETEASGPVRLTPQFLAKCGFNDPAAVKVFGSGGKRISDILSEENFADDLPQVATQTTPSGVVFYAVGTEEWTGTAGGHFTHKLNPFSSVARYFITDRSDIPALSPGVSGISPTAEPPTTTFTERIYHELDQISPGESGHLLIGEDLAYGSERNFMFQLPGVAAGSKGWLQLRAVAELTSAGRINLTANGTYISAEEGTSIGPTPTTAYASLSTISGYFPIAEGKVTASIKLRCEGVVKRAAIDCIDINYTRQISMTNTGGYLLFTSASSETALDGVSPGLRIWDVTDPLAVTEVSYQIEGTKARWRSSFGPGRTYLAWTEKAQMKEPTEGTRITNTNLHDLTSNPPDMVILAPSSWRNEAERIAALHRSDTADPLDVAVVDLSAVYNEFGSGLPDIGSLRRFLKMLYDHGLTMGRPLRYALILGAATHDNRHLSPSSSSEARLTVATWQTDESLRKYESFSSDDILAMLDDNSGQRMASDRHCIAVGRIPAASLSELTGYVDKLADYYSDKGKADTRQWKNRVLLVADDGNDGKHLQQTETMAANMLASDGGKRMVYTKAYVDAFEIVGGTCEGARRRMMRELDNGTLWWCFTGHAGLNFLTGDNILTYGDAVALSPAHLPVFFGATCSFARFDGSQRSGAEIMLLKPTGGVIAAISATREVFIDENGLFSAEIGREAFAIDSCGRYPTIGQAFMNAKNRLASPAGISNDNKLRYVLLGDPAMRYAISDNYVRIDSINGRVVDGAEIPAGSVAQITGSIHRPDGSLLSDFNGNAGLDLYDADRSTTSLGRVTALDGEGRKISFDEHGELLFTGRDTVVAGRFSMRIPLPLDIADNYRPATLSAFASSRDGTEATGCNRSFFVYGVDDMASTDTIAPVIDQLYLNHESFTEGGRVNPSPMLIADISDNVGINLSTAGIGNLLTITLDPDSSVSKNFSDAASFFHPSPDGSPSGTIRYPLSELTTGVHTLTLRVSDTSGNTSSRSIQFIVDQNLSPRLFSVWTDSSPASSSTNFYISHNRPDAVLTLKISVYDLSGRLVWTTTATDRSDMFISAPVRWDLRDMGGRRVARGIYIYRVSVNEPSSESSDSLSGKLAVAAR